MGKKKSQRNNQPRRKRFAQSQRLASARKWLPTYQGAHVVKAYRKRYGVDWPTAFKELAILGVSIDPGYRERVLKWAQERSEAQKRKRMEKSDGALADDQDEQFAYIAGYTEWGFPYGLTWEELEEIERAKAEEQSGPEQSAQE
jgi:hypothetical protein